MLTNGPCAIYFVLIIIDQEFEKMRIKHDLDRMTGGYQVISGGKQPCKNPEQEPAAAGSCSVLQLAAQDKIL
jgi:hypothetical protein